MRDPNGGLRQVTKARPMALGYAWHFRVRTSRKMVEVQNKFRPPDIAEFGAEGTHLSAPEVRTNTCPVFRGGHGQPAEAAKVSRQSLRTHACPLSPVHEHPTSLGAALAGGVEYRGDQCALQLADRSGSAGDRRRRIAGASLWRRGCGR